MNSHMLSYLHGFLSYTRSYNLRVLAGDEQIGTAYKQAKLRGRLPFNRSKILILGDHGVGKTSTCRRLQGKDFRDDEASTVGIETNTVKANEPWWAVSHVEKTNKIKTSKTNNRYWRIIVEDVFFPVLICIPIMILFKFLVFGFGFIVWVYIISLMSIVDIHSAYRFGCGFAFPIVIIDGAYMELTYFDHQLRDMETDVLINIVKTVILYGAFSIVTGFMAVAGGRTGVCVALCFMVHPLQKDCSYTKIMETVHTSYLEFILSMLVPGLSVLVFKNVHVKFLQLRWINYVFITVFLIIKFVIVSIYIGWYSLQLLKCFIIVVVVGLTLTGCMLAMKCTAYGYVTQSYIIKKTIGFIFGLCMAKLVKWEFRDFTVLYLDEHQQTSIQIHLFPVLVYIVPLISFIVYECLAYIKVRNTLDVPLSHICQSLKAQFRNESYLDARLSLWDFAGQKIYYNTHHLFMPKQGVYLILFNAAEAVRNPEKQIKRLKFWLQSVAMHAEVGNVVVLLVGTRRESVRDMNSLLDFSRLAKVHLYKRFSKFIAFHPSGNMLFYVENALNKDEEIKTLRKVIHNEITNMKYFHEKFSVKYLLFNEILNKFRLKKSIITSLDTISEEAKTACGIMPQNELRQFLNFFDKSGDVIYKEHDKVLQNYVICDPQMLVSILIHLVNVPALHKRNRKVADYWQRLEDTGIVDSRLIEDICREEGIWTMYPYVIRFLVGTHLLFPLNVADEIDQVGIFCLSCRLPKVTLMSTLWNYNDQSQDIFYFDFGEILPECMFLRLIAKCCERFTWEKIYYDAARFRTSKSCLLFISANVVSENNSYERNLIKVAVHNDDQTQVTYVLNKLISFTAEIINRDFNSDHREQYTCGPKCERCSSVEGKMCLVNLITPCNDVTTLDGYRPDLYHMVSLEPKLSFSCSH
ncbi:uncharacterized protein LOC117115053 [Anneissia japonica]|uniref:uncharacterized protein LOC117115053 n=1 Tax=Anneissia japonica TaxID=1529436 RepID=UPI0014256046|nr:uncharacterized protein LOC117115053 [Anneissia japonica]